MKRTREEQEREALVQQKIRDQQEEQEKDPVENERETIEQEQEKNSQ